MMWIVKRVVIGKVNDLLKKYKGDVEKIRETLTKWTERIEKVLSCFKSVLAKIEDNELDEKELKDTADEVSALIKEW